jgi:hypothetical protein
VRGLILATASKTLCPILIPFLSLPDNTHSRKRKGSEMCPLAQGPVWRPAAAFSRLARGGPGAAADSCLRSSPRSRSAGSGDGWGVAPRAPAAGARTRDLQGQPGATAVDGAAPSGPGRCLRARGFMPRQQRRSARPAGPASGRPAIATVGPEASTRPRRWAHLAAGPGLRTVCPLVACQGLLVHAGGGGL